jgi:hypothetical protein
MVPAALGSALDSPEAQPLRVAADTEVDQPEQDQGAEAPPAAQAAPPAQPSQPSPVQPSADEYGRAAPAAGKHTVAQTLYSAFKSRGWTDAAAVGATANALDESNLNPTAAGDQGTSHGAFQFHQGSHLEAYRNFANSIGADPTNPRVQADYVGEWVDRHMPGYGQMIDPRAATDAFMTGFERPADQTPGRRFSKVGEAEQLILPAITAHASGEPAGRVQLASAAGNTFSDAGPTFAGAPDEAQVAQSSWRPPSFDAVPTTGARPSSTSVAVPVAPPGPAASTGPQTLGPYQTMSEAYGAKPANTSNYVLRQADSGWTWTPRSSLPQDGTSPYYSPQDQASQQLANSPSAHIMAPGGAATSEAHSVGSWLHSAADWAADTNLGRGYNRSVATMLDLGGSGLDWIVNKGMQALGAGSLPTPPNASGPAAGSLQYGNPYANTPVAHPYDDRSATTGIHLKSLGADIANRDRINLDEDPNGILSDAMFAAGNAAGWGLGTLPLVPALGGNALVAGLISKIPLVGRLLAGGATGAYESAASAPLRYAAQTVGNTAAMGVGSAEAHDVYKGATGREGDLGDTLSTIVGGGAWNALRLPLIALGESTAVTAAKNAASGIASGVAKAGSRFAWNAAKDVAGADSAGSLPEKVGQAATDSYLANTLQQNLNAARQQVDALGTALPGDSATYRAAQSEAGRDAVRAWQRGSRAEERQLWSPSVTTWKTATDEQPVSVLSEAPIHGDDGQLYQRVQLLNGQQQQVPFNQLETSPGVNLAMPRNFQPTVGLYNQLKADALSPTNLRDPKSFPLELDDALAGKNGLQNVDTLGRGQDLRSRIGGMVDQEIGKGAGADAAKIGYLRQLQSSLKGDLQSGAEGANPGEVDAYRRAMSFSASRAQLANTPEMTDFMSGKTPDEAALDKLIKQGPAGVSAADFVTQAAQQKYGSEGILGATKDAIRQKYADAVAPYGYVDLAAHDRFMQRFGGLLDNPQFDDVKTQLADAGAAENTVNSTTAFGKPGGFRSSMAQQAVRDARSDLYLDAPTKTVIDHLEGVKNPAQATSAVLGVLDKDPTGQASIGFQHAVAVRAATDPSWLSAHPELTAAIDRFNPGFTARAAAFQNPATVQGLTKIGTDFIASIVGSRVGRMIPGTEHTGLVATGRGAQAGRQIVGNTLNKIFNTSVEDRASQIVGNQQWLEQVQKMTPEERANFIISQDATQAFGNAIGNVTRTITDKAKDMMQVFNAAPAWAASYGITDPNFASGTGQPGSATNAGGPPAMRGSSNPAPWHQQLQYLPPAAVR